MATDHCSTHLQSDGDAMHRERGIGKATLLCLLAAAALAASCAAICEAATATEVAVSSAEASDLDRQHDQGGSDNAWAGADVILCACAPVGSLA